MTTPLVLILSLVDVDDVAAAARSRTQADPAGLPDLAALRPRARATPAQTQRSCRRMRRVVARTSPSREWV
ncbi:protein of unknown function [Pararobbsia alpina]